MKTIMDAVNELNAEWVYKDSISAYFRPAIPCDSGYWYYGESKPFNDEHVCTLEEFSECVSECSFNFGKCSHAEFNAWLEATKQHHSEAEKPTYTQAMLDNGELPINGLVPGYYYEFKDNKNKHWEVGVLLNVEGGKYQSKCGNKTEWFDKIAQCTGVFGKVDVRSDKEKTIDDIVEMLQTYSDAKECAKKIHEKWVK